MIVGYGDEVGKWEGEWERGLTRGRCGGAECGMGVGCETRLGRGA